MELLQVTRGDDVARPQHVRGRVRPHEDECCVGDVRGEFARDELRGLPVRGVAVVADENDRLRPPSIPWRGKPCEIDTVGEDEQASFQVRDLREYSSTVRVRRHQDPTRPFQRLDLVELGPAEEARYEKPTHDLPSTQLGLEEWRHRNLV